MTIDWARLLAEYRKSAGVKQQALARDLGVSQATISRWENGAARPSIAVQNLLLRMLRRERSPMRTVHWVETFRRMGTPGLVVADGGMLGRTMIAATEGTANLCGVPAWEIENRDLGELFVGELLETYASIVGAGLYSGRVMSFEAITRIEYNPEFRRAPNFWIHSVGWPHAVGDNQIVCVSQGVPVSQAEAAETRSSLGGAHKLLFAD
jgi:DNA-binding XRE family transcriptional regulator